MKIPTFHYERELMARGYRVIVGVDEAGAGCLAGPVVAAAVVLPLDSRLKLIRDSKLLTERNREILFDQIAARADAWAIGSASHEEINKIGIRQANYLAMERAIEQIEGVEFALVDAWTLPNLKIPQNGIIKGDTKIKSIAAASIMAKVTRDRHMLEQARLYPEYGFERHKGYGTKFHQEAIHKHGPCPIHRTSWEIFQK
ncbi:MAG: ribonuclease HII [Patescibacteria group bacterium]